MHQLYVHRTINLAAEKLWPALADFGGIYKFHPGVRHSETLTKGDVGVGTKRLCVFYDNNSIKESITGYHENNYLELELYDMDFPIKAANARFNLIPINANTTKIEMTFNFLPKFGPIGWMMAKLMMKPQFKKVLTNMLKGLEDHVRTGRIVNQDGHLIDAEIVSA